MVRALLVDDEQPARERLRRLLAAFDEVEVEVVGEAEDGEHAFEQILALTPDVVFLDIQMPGCSGLDVAASLPALRPKLVFCTAFGQHAVDAFELQAVDYLLKPVTRARLAEAIRRLPCARAAPGRGVVRGLGADEVGVSGSVPRQTWSALSGGPGPRRPPICVRRGLDPAENCRTSLMDTAKAVGARSAPGSCQILPDFTCGDRESRRRARGRPALQWRPYRRQPSAFQSAGRPSRGLLTRRGSSWRDYRCVVEWSGETYFRRAPPKATTAP